MPAFIVKPTRDRDFYVRWSTVVDDVTSCGSRVELTEYLEKFGKPNGADPARFDRADETGSSGMKAAAGWFGWGDEEFVLGQYEDPRAVKRADLEAYAVALCSDKDVEAMRHTYVLPDEEAEGARPAAPSAPATPAVGVRPSEGATGAPGGAGEVGLGDALRAAADYQDRPGAYDEMRALADRADALEREVGRLGELVDETETYARRYQADAELLTAEVLRQRTQVERLHRHGADHLCTECQSQYPCETYLAVGGTQ